MASMMSDDDTDANDHVLGTLPHPPTFATATSREIREVIDRLIESISYDTIQKTFNNILQENGRKFTVRLDFQGFDSDSFKSRRYAIQAGKTEHYATVHVRDNPEVRPSDEVIRTAFRQSVEGKAHIWLNGESIELAAPVTNVARRGNHSRHQLNMAEDIPVESYNMEHYDDRGLCLILNALTMDPDPVIKKGSKKDALTIAKTFLALDFFASPKEPRNVEDIRTHMKEAYEERRHEDKDCVVIFILSHGTRGGKILCDGQTVSIEELKSPFRDVRSLRGKPKMLFILSCRGDDPMPSVLGEAGFIAVEADFLIYQSTVEGYVSHMHKDGSTFVTSLCEAIQKYSPVHDLLTILTYVNDQVQKSDKGGEKMIPCITSTLRKLLYFSKPGNSPVVSRKRTLDQDVPDGSAAPNKASATTSKSDVTSTVMPNIDKTKFMTDAHKKKLREKLSFLVDNMQSTLQVAEDLLSATALTQAECDRVKAKTTRGDQNSELMSIVSLKSDFAFDALLNALETRENYSCLQALK